MPLGRAKINTCTVHTDAPPCPLQHTVIRSSFSYFSALPTPTPSPLLLSCAPTRPRSLCATNEPHTNNGNESEILIYGALDAIRYFHYPIYCLPASLPADKLPLSLSLCLSPLVCPASNLLQLLLLMPLLIAAAMRFMCALMILTLMMRLPIVSLVTHKLQTGILNMPTAHKSHHSRAKLQRRFQ